VTSSTARLRTAHRISPAIRLLTTGHLRTGLAIVIGLWSYLGIPSPEAQAKRLIVAQAVPQQGQPSPTAEPALPLIRQAGELKASGDLRGAVETARKAVALQPNLTEARYLLATALEEAGDQDGAIAEYESILKLSQGHLDNHFRLGLLYGQRGDYNAAIRSFSTVLRKDQEHLAARFNIGLPFRKTGDNEWAKRHFELVLKQDPRHAGAHTGLGNIAYDKGDLREAIDEYRLALDNDPGYLRARRNLAVALNQSGDAPQALEEYRALIKVQTSDPLLYLEYADTLRTTDQKAEAAKAYQQALNLLPLTTDQSETRARIENQLKQLAQ
jgi:tetratricopeptide (TPR) repeat protein